MCRIVYGIAPFASMIISDESSQVERGTHATPTRAAPLHSFTGKFGGNLRTALAMLLQLGLSEVSTHGQISFPLWLSGSQGESFRGGSG